MDEEVSIAVTIAPDGSASAIDDDNEQLLREASWASGYCQAKNSESGLEVNLRYLGGRWIEW